MNHISHSTLSEQPAHPATARLRAMRGLTVLALLASFVFTTFGAPAPRVAQAQTDTCNALTGVINDYWPGTNSPAAGTNTIQLGARRAGGRGLTINPGDMLLVIQVMGADINFSDTADYGDGPGGLTGSGFISNTNFVAGRYEYVEALNSVGASGGMLTIRGKGTSFGLLNSYVNADATATTGPRRFQVVRVPQCATASLSGDLTAAAFDGFTGGILALDVNGQLNLNGRNMNVSGLGYRGGGEGVDNNFCHRALVYASTDSVCNAPKGEGFAGTPVRIRVGNSSASAPLSNLLPGGTLAAGAPANGGGGGAPGNSAGGGGGNGGTGGKGGWGSDMGGGNRIDNGGFGGAPLPAVFGASRIVMGGGGGAGEGDTAGGYAPTFGGGGGGIVLVRADAVQGTSTVLADGAAGLGGTPTDAGGGGGAGGTIVFTVRNGPLSSISLFARGG